jgi:hypothetical protein
MTYWLVPPSPPTGKSHRIELAGIDLWVIARIDNLFVYPSELNVDRLRDALGRTLSLWPLVAGRFLLLEDNHYVIEMSDNAIPIIYAENTELPKWPVNSNVVVKPNENNFFHLSIQHNLKSFLLALWTSHSFV